VKKFSELNIKANPNMFSGKKISINDILNEEITVDKFKIEPSKYKEKGNGNRLVLQIEYDKRKRVVFVSSVILMEMIAKVKESDFPFNTTIVRKNDYYEFT
jgi:hypothetical protein